MNSAYDPNEFHRQLKSGVKEPIIESGNKTVKRYWTTDEVNERVNQKVKEERLKVVAEILTELEAAGYGVDWNLFEIIKKLEHTK